MHNSRLRWQTLDVSEASVPGGSPHDYEETMGDPCMMHVLVAAAQIQCTAGCIWNEMKAQGVSTTCMISQLPTFVHCAPAHAVPAVPCPRQAAAVCTHTPAAESFGVYTVGPDANSQEVRLIFRTTTSPTKHGTHLAAQMIEHTLLD